MLQAANVTDELLRVVRTKQIDLLVAGAYGHSQLGEWVFGGVTRDLLHKSPVCCLYSHNSHTERTTPWKRRLRLIFRG
jgi:hypothetical protein